MAVPFEVLADRERERKKFESGERIEQHAGQARSLIAGISFWKASGQEEQYALVYAAAQVEATLALVEAVRSLTERLDR